MDVKAKRLGEIPRCSCEWANFLAIQLRSAFYRLHEAGTWYVVVELNAEKSLRRGQCCRNFLRILFKS